MWYVVQVVGGRERRVLHLVEQLVDDIFKILWKRLTHLGTGIFGGAQPADIDHPV